jgi:hypothetical protein
MTCDQYFNVGTYKTVEGREARVEFIVMSPQYPMGRFTYVGQVRELEGWQWEAWDSERKAFRTSRHDLVAPKRYQYRNVYLIDTICNFQDSLQLCLDKRHKIAYECLGLLRVEVVNGSIDPKSATFFPVGQEPQE